MKFPVVTIVWGFLVYKAEGGTMGPWMALVEKIVPCQDATYKDLPAPMLLTINKKGKTGRVVTAGSLDAPIGLNDDFEMSMRVLELKNGRADKVADRNFGGACTALETWLRKHWRLLASQSPMECLPEGSMPQCCKPGKGDLTVPFDIPPVTVASIPSFLYGDYRVDLLWQHTNQTVFACSSAFTTVVKRLPIALEG